MKVVIFLFKYTSHKVKRYIKTRLIKADVWNVVLYVSEILIMNKKRIRYVDGVDQSIVAT